MLRQSPGKTRSREDQGKTARPWVAKRGLGRWCPTKSTYIALAAMLLLQILTEESPIP